MKQLLIDVIEFLKEERELNMSDISKGLGKGRNFISEAIKRGYKDEEQYTSLSIQIMDRLFGIGDIFEFCKFMNKKHRFELYKTEIAGDKVIDSLHERLSDLNQSKIEKDKVIDGLREKLENMNESKIEKDKVITKQSETIKSLEHRITMLNKNIDAYSLEKRKSATRNYELSVENDKHKESMFSLQKSNQSHKSAYEAQDIAIKKLKKDLALQESLFLEQDLELRKYKSLADGKEQQVQACFRALSSSKKEKAYLFGGFILLAVLVLVILYLSFIHIAI